MIEGIRPEIDAGRFPIKRAVGEDVVVEADVFADGHDSIGAALRYRHEDNGWSECPMEFIGNDRWRASFPVTALGIYHYTITGWIDHFATWRRDMIKRREAGQNVQVDLLIGAQLIEAAGKRADGSDARTLAKSAQTIRTERLPLLDRIAAALSDDLAVTVSKYPDRRFASTYDRELSVVVDREKARFSTWYEMFPRSSSGKPGEHGTFKDLEARLPYVASMGFDVLYLPPIHPIGTAYRKGKNNNPAGAPDEPGSPWAIGSEEGGHKAIHPDLGTLDDFRQLIARAHTHGIEIAMDIAFQCSPDHPYVKEHREWFKIRPDGTVQYAENPPKKYQDIFPLDFETDQWKPLWDELKSVFDYWIAQGVKIFRVDNPHTKSFAFWEWVIGELRRRHPDVIFLSEAFTRPKVMYRLAKLGFTQSYNYFPWRNTKTELTQYFTELTRSEVTEFFRPNLWPNTPDILTEHLQHGGRPAFMSRLVLAATLGASYGIYGPAFELGEHRPLKQGSEEYLDSEKYEIRHWNLDRPESLREFIACVNRIRRENPALQRNERLHFHSGDNDQLICYSKSTSDLTNVIVIVVNLSPYHVHSGWLQLDLAALGLEADRPFQVQDLLTNAYYLWQGARNYIQVDPHSAPAHIFRVRRRLRTEQDFDYYL